MSDNQGEQMQGEAAKDGATMQIYKTAKRARLAAEAAAEKLEREQRERRRMHESGQLR